MSPVLLGLAVIWRRVRQRPVSRADPLAAMDVEWFKNYRVRGGNVPFCYSVVWFALPADDACTGLLEEARFWYTSAYVQDASEVADLVAGADAVLACLLGVAGHQLCSDLGVLAAADPASRPAVAAAVTAWRQRREASTCATVGQRVIDIPPNMTTAERVRWIAARVTRLGLTRDAPVAT